MCLTNIDLKFREGVPTVIRDHIGGTILIQGYFWCGALCQLGSATVHLVDDWNLEQEMQYASKRKVKKRNFCPN